MIRSSLRLATALALALTAGTAAAQPTGSGPAPVLNVGSSENAISRKLDLSIGRSLIVELPRDAKEVFVANPKVANAVVRTARKLFVIGIADGSTSMFVMDGDGQQITALDINVGRDLNVLRQTLRTALPNSQIEIKPAGDSILLVGTVPNASDATQAVDIAKAFVGGASSWRTGTVINSLTIRDRDQVMVKVMVSEVSRKAIKQLGINTTGEWNLGKFSVFPTIDNPFSLSPQALSATAIAASVSGDPLKKNITIRALERAGMARVLAEPTVTAISGESAKFTAGGEIPVPSGYTCDPAKAVCSLGVQYKPIGVALNFTPIVLSANKISMRIATEVTELDFENQIVLQGDRNQPTVTVPAFRVRKSDTTVELPSGGTLATAGLIQRVSKTSINGLPGLMNLPIIGVLFRSRDYQREETELMITVTPYIAKPMQPTEVQRPDDGFVETHDSQAILLGRLNKIYGSGGGPVPQAYKGRVGFIAD
ncbi:MAG: type II and III secretion system protein family protein [Bosea sp.]|uniref:type II and III secretion system protein family protein n=1 Tax=Bosea sp. (in: a-proteobacteria) TaxID=1871050 RepID=UPI001AC66956|nr:type II and III secretion system protein family protein [Bosea sp. (in: a-proteobacteria)]MBN9453686.1 type II and III secretion system protein family protein [Bosea sp. (in: a-proteobacteria)]